MSHVSLALVSNWYSGIRNILIEYVCDDLGDRRHLERGDTVGRKHESELQLDMDDCLAALSVFKYNNCIVFCRSSPHQDTYLVQKMRKEVFP